MSRLYSKSAGGKRVRKKGAYCHVEPREEGTLICEESFGFKSHRGCSCQGGLLLPCPRIKPPIHETFLLLLWFIPTKSCTRLFSSQSLGNKVCFPNIVSVEASAKNSYFEDPFILFKSSQNTRDSMQSLKSHRLKSNVWSLSRSFECVIFTTRE